MNGNKQPPPPPHTHTQVGSSSEAAVPLCNIPSIRFGSGFLARTFARLVKDMADTLQQVCNKEATDVRP